MVARMTTYFYSPKPLRTPPARWGGRLPPLGTHPPRYMHFLFAFIYPRKLSTITAFPHSSHQHIIKWLPTPLGTYLPRYLPYAVGYLGRCGWLPREVLICGVGRGCGSCAVRGGVPDDERAQAATVGMASPTPPAAGSVAAGPPVKTGEAAILMCIWPTTDRPG